MLPTISVIVYPGVSVDGAPLVESALAELLGLDGQIGTLELVSATKPYGTIRGKWYAKGLIRMRKGGEHHHILVYTTIIRETHQRSPST